MSATDDLLPIPPQPEISEGNQAFHQKAYNFYRWMREKLGPAIIENVDLMRNAVTGAFTGTSTDSITIIDTGDISFETDPSLSFRPGTPFRLASSSSPLNYIDGVTKTYDVVTGAMVGAAQGKNGSGTFSDWSLTIIPSGSGLAGLGTNKFTGLQSMANEVTVASASTLDFTALDTNQVKITGSTTLTGVTMPQSAVIIGRPSGALPLTNSAGFIVQGGADYICSPGDLLVFTKDGDGNVRVVISPINGKPIKEYLNATNDSTFASNSSHDAISAEWANAVTFGRTASSGNIAGSRISGVTYYNTSKRVKKFKYVSVNNVSPQSATFTIAGNSYSAAVSANNTLFISDFVGPGESYSFTTTAGALSVWEER